MNQSFEFLVMQRISTNRCMAELEKKAWVGAAVNAAGRLGSRALGTVGSYAVRHPLKTGFGALMAYQGVGDAKNLAQDWKNYKNIGGNRFITADGHARSSGANIAKTLGTIGDWTWWIPGFGWASAAISLGGHALGAAIQNRADRAWAGAQQRLQASGYDSSKPFGAYSKGH